MFISVLKFFGWEEGLLVSIVISEKSVFGILNFFKIRVNKEELLDLEKIGDKGGKILF